MSDAACHLGTYSDEGASVQAAPIVIGMVLAGLVFVVAAVLGGRRFPTGARPIAFCATLLWSFICLGVIAHNAVAGTAADHAVLAWMVDHRHGWLTSVAVAVTNAASPVATGLLAVVAAAAFWWRMRSPLPAVVVVATLGVTGAASTITKAVVAAHRPARSVQLVLETDPSFPSGHVAGTLALVGIIAAVVGHRRSSAVRVGLASMTAAIVVAVAATRLYLGGALADRHLRGVGAWGLGCADRFLRLSVSDSIGSGPAARYF
ncbi:MAG: phosphatase PAP2 family protein [Mycobacterium sp.]|uniref:phosphatase PAP2 family protein n=1 Tax=Mycobacterium sp. TaxID=1785 RepID=UPI00389AF742